MKLDEKTVFVTGSGTGIGEATARRAAEEGAFVVSTDLDQEAAQATADAVEDVGAGAVAYSLDVTDADRFHTVVDEVVDEYGLDVLVNNAGTGHQPSKMEETDMATFDFVLDVNVRGVWNGCHAALPHLKEQGSGNVVNVASLAALYGLPLQSVYSLTKAAVLNFTRAVAAESGRDGVRANCVCPGFIDTQLGRAFWESRSDPEAAKAQLLKRYPLGRLGEPEEVAAAICFLASDDASWITGHGLVIDGGFSTS